MEFTGKYDGNQKSKRNTYDCFSCNCYITYNNQRQIFILHNKSYKNQAIERGDAIYLNETKYSPMLSSDLNGYTISNVLICKTDMGMKLYEINEYPDYEYIAGYHEWDGKIYKKDETD